MSRGRKIERTPELLGHIAALRGQGLSWPVIAERMAMPMNTVWDLGVEIGVARLARVVSGTAVVPQRDADPLPAGHAASWGAISGDPWPGRKVAA